MKKYESYKDSGVEWIGEIPSHWEVRKLKYLGKMFAGLTDKKGEDFSKEYKNNFKTFIPFTNVCNNLKIDKNQLQYVKIKNNEIQNKVIKNDIIFLMSSETLEDIGKCAIYLDNDENYLNSFCKGFRILDNNLNAEFLNYLLQSKSYRNYFSIVGRGFTRINIKQEYINNLISLIPPLPEQKQISSFLDEKVEKIEKAISKKEKLIKLLKEHKQVIINEAVTKGIDKNIEYKDSRVEWIGKIPKHWKVRKLKYLGKINNGMDYKKVLSDKGYPVIGSGGQFAFANTYLYNGEVILLGRKGTIDKPLYFIGKFWTVDTMFYYIVNNTNLTKFIYYSVLFIPFKYYSTSTALPSMTQFDLNNHQIPLPPLSEQQKIVSYIEEKISKIDNLIQLQQKQIEKLKEYKITLIDEVVTGKIKVFDE